jgi:hypothetical protein
MENLHRLKNIKMKDLKNSSEVVVEEVGTAAFEVLAAASFAIHVAMQ